MLSPLHFTFSSILHLLLLLVNRITSTLVFINSHIFCSVSLVPLMLFQPSISLCPCVTIYPHLYFLFPPLLFSHAVAARPSSILPDPLPSLPLSLPPSVPASFLLWSLSPIGAVTWEEGGSGKLSPVHD